MAQIPIFYINLAERPDRREFMESQFTKLGLNARRIEATTPKELTSRQRDEYCSPALLNSMTERQFSCNLSHANALEAFVASGAPRGLILEDDVILSASLPRFLSALCSQECPIDVIRIETWPAEPKRYRSADSWVLPDIGLRQCLSWDAGAAGYIVTREAAARLVEAPELRTVLIDTLLFNPFGRLARTFRVRQTDPALCIQLVQVDPKEKLASSDLEDGLVKHRKARRRNFLRALRRKLNGWVSYDLQRATTRIRQLGWRDVSRQNIHFSSE